MFVSIWSVQLESTCVCCCFNAVITDWKRNSCFKKIKIQRFYPISLPSFHYLFELQNVFDALFLNFRIFFSGWSDGSWNQNVTFLGSLALYSKLLIHAKPNVLIMIVILIKKDNNNNVWNTFLRVLLLNLLQKR